MKKLAITIAIVLGLCMTSFADGGGLFYRKMNAENGKSGYVFYDRDADYFTKDPTAPLSLPTHGLVDDQPAPLGSGIALLAGLGAAYLVGKKRREEE